jgi:Tfp pilus assembly protein PilX
MKRPLSPLSNQQGSVMVIALMILVVVTIVGIASMNDSRTEQQLVRNEAIYKQDFYLAESAAIEGAQRLNNLNDRWVLQNQAQPWLNQNEDNTGVNLTDPGNWDTGGATPNAAVAGVDVAGDGTYTVVDERTADDGSLNPNSPQVHEFRVLGQYFPAGRNNPILIEIGYRKQF